MSQSLTRCKIQVNPTLNNSDRLILGEIIVREIRSRTRSGRSARGGTFAKYSPSYTRLLRRRGAATNVDLDRSGQMLESLRVLEHGQGFITIGISSMDKAAFAKAKYTQGQGRGPARLWLRVSSTFVRTQERAILQAGAENQTSEATEADLEEYNAGLVEHGIDADGNPINLQRGVAQDVGDDILGDREFRQLRERTRIGIDISADADRRTIRRLLNESPNRAGETAADRRLFIQNKLNVQGLSSADKRAVQREERRFARLDRLDALGALEIEALRFVRGSQIVQNQFPILGARIQEGVTTFAQTGPAPTPIVESIVNNPIILRNPIAELQERQSVERQQRLQSELDALSSYEGYNRIETVAADPSTRIEQAIPIAERVREEPTVGIDIESAQRGIDRNLGIVRGNQEGRGQLSLFAQRQQDLAIESQRQSLLRRQQRELDRIERQRETPDPNGNIFSSDIRRTRDGNTLSIRERLINQNALMNRRLRDQINGNR